MANIYVSTSGDNTGDGSSSSPLLTLTAAQTKSRILGSGTTVILKNGIYKISVPLAFTSADNGINWKAENYGQATISGGIDIAGWTVDTGSIKKANVPNGTNSRSLYVNGTRCFRARIANQPGSETNSLSSTGYSMNSMPAWTTYGNLTDVELVYGRVTGGISDWTQSRIPIQSVDAVGKTVTMQTNAFENMRQKPQLIPEADGGNTFEGGWDFIENAYELLAGAGPGNFYLNRSTNIVYAIPPNAEDMNTSSVTMPILESLITFNNVSNSTFTGIIFADTTWLQPMANEAYVEIFAGVRSTGTLSNSRVSFSRGMVAMPSAIRMDGCQLVNFEQCTFKRLGSGALTIAGNCSNCRVRGCEFTDISGGGITVGDVMEWQTDTPTHDIQISDNKFHAGQIEYWGTIPILVLMGQRVIITHNYVRDSPYCGVALGMGWHNIFTDPNSNQDNVVSYNFFKNCGIQRPDGGPIYTNGRQRGVKIVGNLINSLGSFFNRCLYMDNGAVLATVENNLCYGVNNAGLFAQDGYGLHICRYNFLDGGGIDIAVENGSGPGGGSNDVRYNVHVTSSILAPFSIVAKAGRRVAYKTTDDSDKPLAVNISGGPSTVQSLFANMSGNTVVLTWSAPINGTPVSYEIKLKNAGSLGQDLILMSKSSTGYTYADVQPNKTLTFIVVPRDSSGNLGIPANVTIATGSVTPPVLPDLFQN